MITKEMLDSLTEAELEIVREYVVNRFDDIISEMAFDRKTVMRKIDGLEKPINLHLIKIIRYKDDLNFDKHINDIIVWLTDIQELDVGKANKKLPESDYFKLLFTNRFTNEHNIKHIEDLEKGSLKKYNDLPKIRSISETLELIYNIHKEISKRLSQNNIWDIEDYIKKLIKN